MIRTLTMAAALTFASAAAFAQCPPGQSLVGGVCSVVSGTVGAAGAVVGGALGAAGAITGGAVNATGQIVGGTVGAVTGAPPAVAPAPQAKMVPGTCGPGYVMWMGGCFPAH